MMITAAVRVTRRFHSMVWRDFSLRWPRASPVFEREERRSGILAHFVSNVDQDSTSAIFGCCHTLDLRRS